MTTPQSPTVIGAVCAEPTAITTAKYLAFSSVSTSTLLLQPLAPKLTLSLSKVAAKHS